MVFSLFLLSKLLRLTRLSPSALKQLVDSVAQPYTAFVSQIVFRHCCCIKQRNMIVWSEIVAVFSICLFAVGCVMLGVAFGCWKLLLFKVVSVNVVVDVIINSTCLGLHLSALTISVLSLFISNSTCCDTDNYIVLLHFYHLTAIIFVSALCCLIVYIFFVLFAFVVAFVFSYLIVFNNDKQATHAVITVVTVCNIHVAFNSCWCYHVYVVQKNLLCFAIKHCWYSSCVLVNCLFLVVIVVNVVVVIVDIVVRAKDNFNIAI